MQITVYKVYCVDDDRFEYTVDTSEPTVCPINNAHSVRSAAAIDHLNYISITNANSPYRLYNKSLLVDTTSGNVTINLPPAAYNLHYIYVIKKTAAANIITVDPYLTETIDESATYTLSAVNETIVIVSDGDNNWGVYALGDDLPSDATSHYNLRDLSEFQAVVSPIGSYFPSDFTSVAAAFASGANTVFIRAGTYVETQDIIIPDRGQLMGESPGKSIIVLAGGNSIIADGSGGVVETTGTVTITNNSKDIVGTGTTFTNLSPGDFILLGTNYYAIASITNDTNLVLSDTYVGAGFTNTTYRAQSMYTACKIAQLSVANSSTYGIRMRGVRHGSMYAVGISGCNPCIEYEHCSDMSILALIPQYSASNGMNIKSCISMSMNIVNAFNCVGHGIDVSGNSFNVVFNSGACENNNGSGINVQTGSQLINISDGICKNNNASGIVLASGVTCCTINNTEVVHNDGVGVDSAAMNSVIAASTIGANTSHGVCLGDGNILDGNKLVQNGAHGVCVPVTTSKVTISGNNISSNVSNGINIEGNYAVIDGNIIYGNVKGIYANNSVDLVFSNNIIKDNTGVGLELDGNSTRSIISANKIDDNASGILIGVNASSAIITSNHIDEHLTDDIVINSDDCLLNSNIGSATTTIAATANNTQIGFNKFAVLVDSGTVDANLSFPKVNILDARSATTLQLGPTIATKVEIADTGVITEILGSLDVAEGCDVIGNITVTGTVDGRDIAADGSAQDAHIASTSNPHSVTAAQVGLGNVINTKNNFAASVAPTTTDDSSSGYSIGSMWIDTSTDIGYLCVDATATSAVWKQITA